MIGAALLIMLLSGCSSSDDGGNPVAEQTASLKLTFNVASQNNWPETRSFLVRGYKSGNFSTPDYEQVADIPSLASASISITASGVSYGTYGKVEVLLINTSTKTAMKLLTQYEDVTVEQSSVDVPAKDIDFTVAPSTYTYSLIQSEIFNIKCVSCHSTSNPLGGLDISAGKSYANMVNVDAVYGPQYKLAAPGDSLKSYLYMTLKSINEAPIMPPDPFRELTQEEISAIAQWIQRGAPNN
jgi:hypothetical protein